MESVNAVTEENMMHHVVDIICLLTASLARDDDEFDNWGLSFIHLVLQSQNLRSVQTNNNDHHKYISDSEDNILRGKYFFCVGKGMAFVLHHDDASGFILVDEVTEALKFSVLQIDDALIQEVIPTYISNFVQFVVQSDSFDARARTVCRHFCELFEISAHKLELEFSNNPDYMSPSPVLNSERSLELCSNELTQHQRESAVLCFRLWRVGAAAAAGGALLAISAQIAAPQIVSSLIALLGISNPFGQFVLGVSNLIAIHSGGGFGVVSSVGASVAGYKMLRRTEPINEFSLEPLHYPIMTQNQGSGILGGSGTIVVHNSERNYIKDKQNLVDQAALSLQDSEDIGIETSLPQPIFILIPGQVDYGELEERAFWGADGITNIEGNDENNSNLQADSMPTVSQLLLEDVSDNPSSIDSLVMRTAPCSAISTSSNDEMSSLVISAARPPRLEYNNATPATTTILMKGNNSVVINLSSSQSLSDPLKSTTPTLDTNNADGIIESTTHITQDISNFVHDIAAISIDMGNIAKSTASIADLPSFCQNIETTANNVNALSHDIQSVVHDVESLIHDVTTFSRSRSNSNASVNNCSNDIKSPHTSQKSTSAADWAWETLTVTEKGWWRELHPKGDAFLLLWARSQVAEFTASCRSFMTDQVTSILVDELLKLTPIQALSWPLTVLEKAGDLDNPWLVTMDRARQAGQLLAVTLVEHCKGSQWASTTKMDNDSEQFVHNVISKLPKSTTKLGNRRPVTLVGYGMGAKVVFECLLELSRMRDNEPVVNGIIENAVLMGAPVGFGMGFASGIDCALRGHGPEWEAARKMVAGRMINCYSSTDWILAFLYRQKSLDCRVAGLQPVVVKDDSQVKKHDDCSDHLSIQIPDHDNTLAIVSDTPQRQETSNKRLSRKVSLLRDIENVDVSCSVKTLLDYPAAIHDILNRLALE